MRMVIVELGATIRKVEAETRATLDVEEDPPAARPRIYSELFPQARLGHKYLRVWFRPSKSILSSPSTRPSKSTRSVD